MTNGRIDNSHTNLDRLYTRRRTTKNKEQRTLIDYILVNHAMYRRCVTHENVWRHNGSNKIRTDHCLSILTTRSATCEGETPTDHLDRITGTRKQTRRIFDKYIIFTDEATRKEYQQACKTQMQKWMHDAYERVRSQHEGKEISSQEAVN